MNHKFKMENAKDLPENIKEAFFMLMNKEEVDIGVIIYIMINNSMNTVKLEKEIAELNKKYENSMALIADLLDK